MGQRGPKPGQYRMRPVPAGSPVAGVAGAAGFAPGAPARPKELSKAGRKVWDRTVPLLDAAGVLAHADRDSLVRYCELAGQVDAMTATIDRDGLMIQVPVFGRYGNAAGTVAKPHPLLRDRAALAGLVDRLAAGLGLTPAGRSRLVSPATAQPKPNRVTELRARVEAARTAFQAS